MSVEDVLALGCLIKLVFNSAIWCGLIKYLILWRHDDGAIPALVLASFTQLECTHVVFVVSVGWWN